MITFDDYELSVADKGVFAADWSNIWRLGVIVFSRPEQRTFKNVIAPSIRYLHVHTGKNVHFYFVGFLNQRSRGYETEVSTEIFQQDEKWFFSPHDFSKMQRKMEAFSKWKYSGGTDLIVVPYRVRNKVFYIDVRKALDLKLSKIATNNKNYDEDEIIQILIRTIESGKSLDGVGNSRIMDSLLEGCIAALKKLCPSGVGEAFDVLEPFATRNLKL